MNKFRREQIVLAALLHDIGKFYQRADTWLGNGSAADNLPNDLLQKLVPFREGKPTYQHAIWTYQFFLEHRQIFENLNLWGPEEESVAWLAAKHHLPETESQHLISLADQWSSGIDRRERDPETPRKEWGNYAFRHTPLRSIFSSLSVDNQKPENDLYHPLLALGIQPEIVFPKEISVPGSENQRENMRAAYQELWDKFIEEFEYLPTGTFTAFVSSLQQLLRKYCWCIPSSTVDRSDVNLYEHLKSTAGIATCLWDYFIESPQTPSSYRQEVQQDSLILLCLDLSGIQSFIYDINSKKAYKSLKGRSFYVEILVREMVDYLLSALNIPSVNTLYQSGGKAFLLLPNTAITLSKLPLAIEDLEKQAFHEDRGTIFPAVGWLPFHYDFQNQSRPIRSSDIGDEEFFTLGDLWKRVAERAADRKRRRFDNLLIERFSEFFIEDSITAQAGESLQVCAVTGEPLVGKFKLLDRDIAVLPRVYQQTEVGRKLKDADAILHAKGIEGDLNFHQLDSSIRLIHTNETIHKVEGGTIYRLNDTGFLPSTIVPEIGYGFQFYGGNRQPLIEDFGDTRPKTFEEMCAISEGRATHLGVLRMDVDNLGQLFIKGLDDRDKSFAAYATLSAQLDLFFSGYLNRLREHEEFRDYVAILYAGGDDIFAVGRWDRLAAFAQEVRSEFARFVGREDLSISAGLVIVHPKFPIYRAADLAHDAELAAKNYQSKRSQRIKNAFCIFGLPISWTEELPEVVAWRDRFVHLKTEHDMASSILHRLREAYSSLQAEPEDLSYKWQTAYFLQRFAERYKKKEAIKVCCEELMQRILHDSTYGADRFLALVALAARWAEYLLAITKPKHNG